MDYFVKNKRELNLILSCLHANKNFNRKSCDKDVFFYLFASHFLQ